MRMIQTPSDILTLFPVRKSKKQKQEFRNQVQMYLKTLGYDSHEEKGSFGARNLVIGDPEKAKFLVTAHYDTCASMIIPNLITPCSLALFLLYQIGVALLILLLPAVIGLLVGCFNYYLGQLCFAGLALLFCYLLMFGPANKTNANDNTSGVITLLEIASSLPKKNRQDVCFALFDLEEAGMIGSASYRNAHKKATDHQVVLNLDCVGDGTEIYLFPTKRLKKDSEKMALLRTCCGRFGQRQVTLREKGFSVYPSDQANFPYGVGICALHRGKLGLYLSRIHTHRDTVLEYTNVNILRAGIVTLVSRAPEK